jgi:hypothetical protein
MKRQRAIWPPTWGSLVGARGFKPLTSSVSRILPFLSDLLSDLTSRSSVNFPSTRRGLHRSESVLF